MIIKKFSNKKTIGFLLIIVGTFFVLFGLQTLNKNSADKVVKDTYEAPQNESDLYVEDHGHGHDEHQEPTSVVSNEEVNEQRSPASGKFDVSENTFKRKSKEILDLAEDYPKNKSRLLEVMSAKDPFKEKGKQPKPHTLGDLKQRQEGALRVLALRVLMQNESGENLKQDLAHVIDRAEDPTMSEIAKAVLKSVEDGRPFFDDYSDAVTEL